VHLIEPVEYPVLLWLMERSLFIVTDSGGIQEEAPSVGKPVIVTREVTERQESVAAGVSVLVGTSFDAIVGAARRLLHDPAHYATMARKLNLYGDGHASERIADLLGLAPVARPARAELA
jgi:UDP-N-acetylglucosamine 2-epimerase (non-hydrolysing)